MKKMNESKDWVCRGKSISELISELESFEDRELAVELSLDGGATSRPINLIGKKSGKCILMYVGEQLD